MFFSKKKNGNDNKNAKNPPVSPSDSIREQALANARAARERLGDDYIQEIAGILQKQQNKLTPEQARAKIMATDADRVAMEILEMLDKNKK